MSECRYWYLQAFLLWDRKSKESYGSIPCKGKRLSSPPKLPPRFGVHVHFVSHLTYRINSLCVLGRSFRLVARLRKDGALLLLPSWRVLEKLCLYVPSILNFCALWKLVETFTHQITPGKAINVQWRTKNGALHRFRKKHN